MLDTKACANDADGRARRDALDQSAGSLCGAVTTEGVQHFACELLKPMQQEGSEHASARKWGVRLLEHFFANNKTCDYSDQVTVHCALWLSCVRVYYCVFFLCVIFSTPYSAIVTFPTFPLLSFIHLSIHHLLL